MTDKIDTSTSRIEKLKELGCADYIHVALASERDAISARVAELEVERDEQIEWVKALADDVNKAEQRAATLEERYLAVVGDKINLRGEVATLEAKLAKARAIAIRCFCCTP